MIKWFLIFFCFTFFCICSKAATPTVDELLKKIERGESPDYEEALEWCGLLRVKEAVSVIERKLKNIDHNHWRLKAKIIKALARIGDPNSIGVLLHCLPEREAVTALNQIDRNWKHRDVTKNYYSKQLAEYNKNNRNDNIYTRRKLFKKLLLLDYNQQNIKNLCLKVLRERDNVLIESAIDKLVELNAREAIEPLLDILVKSPQTNFYICLRALDEIWPEWRESKRGKEIGKQLVQNFKEKKDFFYRHIPKRNDSESDEKYLENKSSEQNSDFYPFIEDTSSIGAKELRDALRQIEKVRVPAAKPLLLKIIQNKQELLALRLEVLFVMDELFEPKDSKLINALIENLNAEQISLQSNSLIILVLYGEKYPDYAHNIPQREKIIKKLRTFLKNPDEECSLFIDSMRGLQTWGGNCVVDDFLEVVNKKPHCYRYYTLRITKMLSNFNDPRVMTTLMRLYQEAREYHKKEYIKIFGRLRDRKALPILQKELYNKDRTIRAYAEWAIYNINKE